MVEVIEEWEATPVKAKAIAVLMSFVSSNAIAADAGCKANPAVTGPCFSAQGIVFLTGDIGPALGIDGPKHSELIIRAAPNSEKDMPNNLKTLMVNAIGKTIFAEVHGTYEVCPIPEQPSQFPPGTERYVCINSASHLKLGRGIPKRENSN